MWLDKVKTVHYLHYTNTVIVTQLPLIFRIRTLDLIFRQWTFINDN